jgi:hypothetical protein
MRNGITDTPALTALSISFGMWAEEFDFEEKTKIMTRQPRIASIIASP